MSTRSLKAAAAASVLALALMVPSAFAYGGIELEKNCSNGLGLLDTTQCSYNVADPSGHQDVHQGAINANVNIPVQLAFQDQDNDQDAEAKVEQRNETGWQIPVAVAVAKSGESKAYGHEAYVDIWAPQYANAGIKDAEMEVESDTGSADVEHSANGDTTAFGPNTGNYQEAEAKIEGRDAEAKAEDAIAPGGDGGSNYGANGGDVEESGNGGWAVEATIAEAKSEGGDGGNGGHDRDMINPTTSRVDGNAKDPKDHNEDGTGGGDAISAVIGGDANGGAGGSSTAGAGGTQTAGAGAAGGTATNIALAKNVGDNANAQAWNSATSGNASMGNTYGNMAQGGSTGNNCTSGTMTGGSAANVLGVAVTQSGNVSSYSGTATQNGNPTASAATTVTQTGTPSVSQSQNPNQGSTNTGGSNTQTSGSTQSAGQTVTSGAQTASGTASGLSGNTVTVTSGSGSDETDAQ